MFANKPEKKRYKIIESLDSLKALSKKMLKLEEFAFDTETNTLKVYGKNNNFKLVGVSISWGEYNNYYIPLGHSREEDFDKQVTLAMFRRYMREPFEREDVRIVGANLKFDMHVLSRVGIDIKTKDLFDVIIASWLCDENSLNGLKSNSQQYLKIDQTHFKEVIADVPKEVKKAFGLKSNNKATFDLTLIEESAPYAVDDAFYTWELYLGFMDLLESEKMLNVFERVYKPFIRTLYDMEERGVTIDTDKLQEMKEEVKKDIEQLLYDIIELAGVEFSPSSNQQLAELLFGYEKLDKEGNISDKCNQHILEKSFGFKVVSATAKGAPQTNALTLFKLSKMQYSSKRKKEGVKLCEKLLAYKRLEKLSSAFIDGMEEQIYSDGKVHPNFKINGTDSGRLSCIAENTPIKCVGEDKAIQDIKVGDMVYCYDNFGKVKVRKVLNVMNNGTRPCIRVNWESQGTHSKGELVCTPDHRIRLRNGKWVEASELKNGDRVTHLICFNHKIVGLENVGERKVYDLEVEEFHNFIASEICVHNCSTPNLQQLPKADDNDKYQIRSLFIGSIDQETNKRKKIISCDYSNLEMRVLAHFSEDKNLLKMFAEGSDTHGSTAVNMFELKCEPNEVKKKYPHLRQAAKIINFLLMYGGGASTLYENLKNDRNSPINLSDKHYLEEYKVHRGEEVAQVYIDKYFTSYSGVAKFIRNQKKYAHRHGYVYTLLRRKRRLPDISSTDFKRVAYCERLSVNSTVQGSAADITMCAQNRIAKDPWFAEHRAYMLIQVHDELVFECPEEYVEECEKRIQKLMGHPFGDDIELNLPMNSEYDSGDSYQEAK